ncbi:hypothetical protein A2U01_0083000 [Trifolium medium]|uniref:Uncharacterized protein n=1 Tax=Trifolium medium TaxID=97028 RepID=A0A392TKS5_9FABA|nr:hypothetical protein [Trifolium medium]
MVVINTGVTGQCRSSAVRRRTGDRSTAAKPPSTVGAPP